MKTSVRRRLAVGGVVTGVVGLAGAALYRLRRGRGTAGQESVGHVDLQRYMGKWYEIARYPVSFEQGCFGSAFEFSQRPDGKIVVLFSCRKGSFEAPVETGETLAVVSDPATNAKFSFQSFSPLSDDYMIIDLDKKYRYSVASNSDKSAVWIFSRTPEMDQATYDRIIARLAAKGFDTGRIARTPQPKEELAVAR